tara:strand:- start:361 stop:738 length:378 start_codon:yes stop_codon:yes gene_type:complete
MGFRWYKTIYNMNKYTHTIEDLVNQLDKIDFTSNDGGKLVSSSFIVSYQAKIKFDHTTEMYGLLPKVMVVDALSKTMAYGWDLSNKDEANVFLTWFATKQAKITSIEYSINEANKESATSKFFAL